jgi:two-component system cell cycle sensor histidine kinase/response regulator CckA
VIQRARPALSLRVTFILAALAALAYVGVLTSQLVTTVVPAANDLRGRSADLMEDQNRITRQLAALQQARRDLSRHAPPFVAGAPATLPRSVIRDSVQRLLERGAASQASIERAGLPLEMRLLLADAAQLEASIAVLLLDADRALGVGRPDDAVDAMRASGVLSDSATRVLARAQQVALAGLLESQEQLITTLTRLERSSIGIVIIGLVLFIVATWRVRARVLLPITRMERAVERVSAGDLSTEIRITHRDELGRLAKHLNAMTVVLRERAAEETRRRESLTERFGRILDESSNEICVFDAESLALVQANRGARERMGLTPELMASTRLPDLLGGLDAPRQFSLLEELRSPSRPRVMLTTWLRRRDGALRPTELTLQMAQDAESSVIITVAEDAGVRQQVRLFEERIRAFSTSQQDALARGDLDAVLRALVFSSCEPLEADRIGIWKLGPEGPRPLIAFDTALGAFNTALDADVAVGSATALREVIRPGGREQAELIIVRSRGDFSPEERTFAVALAEVATRAFESAERYTLEQALVRAQRMDSIGQLAGGVAHDFNNLLTAILGNIEATRSEFASGSDTDLALAEAQHAALRAADLTRQLMTFARQQIVETRAVRVELRLNEAEAMLRRLVGPERHLVLNIEEPVGSVRLGSGQLEQLLVNLVVNARDATQPGGTITVAARGITLQQPDLAEHPGLSAGAHVELVVRDTGSGMDAATQERIFEPFFTTKRVGEGTGLGLAVCYGIVRNAGGAITVSSTVGAGSAFRIVLPHSGERESPKRGSKAGPMASGELVIVAEDEPSIRSLVSRMLAARGFRVLAGADGTEALRLAREDTESPRLLLTDVMMPNMGGIELARALRVLHPRMPILFMSGYAATASEEAADFPDAAFIAKPFTSEDLLRRISELLDTAASGSAR